jgi:hypothetical protein
LKAHFMNFVKLNVSRGHVFPEFPNSEHEWMHFFLIYSWLFSYGRGWWFIGLL